MDQTIEIWRVLEEYSEIKVEISSWGHLKIDGEQQRVRVDQQGYPYFYIPTPYMKRVPAHILVCKTFNGPKPYPNARCRFKDNVVTHLTANNLFWHYSNAKMANKTTSIEQAKYIPIQKKPSKPKESRKGKHYWEDLPPPLR